MNNNLQFPIPEQQAKILPAPPTVLKLYNKQQFSGNFFLK